MSLVIDPFFAAALAEQDRQLQANWEAMACVILANVKVNDEPALEFLARAVKAIPYRIRAATPTEGEQ